MDDKSRRTQNIERLAAALQNCFDAAVEEGSLRAEKRMNERMHGFDSRMGSFESRMGCFESRMGCFEARMDGFESRMDRFEARFDRRMDRQDETLRMVWKQVKGEGSLPVDVRD